MGMAAFLGFALAGCSDDVIDVNNQEQQVSNEPAYLSVSFSGSSTSSRSTADDANNQGDKDGDQEHSGHINLGTEGENNVNNALVVIKSTQDGVGGYARLYGSTEGNNNTPGVEVGKGEIDENGELIDKTVAGETIYQAGEPIELTANTFEVLVVVNPYESLYAEYAQSLGAGTRNDAVIAALFNAITTGKYAVKEPTLKNFTGEIVTINNNDVAGIMMANKELPQIKLAPGLITQEVEIPVERVASKITFRITEKNNVYPIVVPDPSKPIVITVENYKDNEGEHKLNKATYEGIEYPVYFEFNKNATTGENEFIAAWKETATEGATSKTFEKIADFKNYDASKAEFDYTYETMTWNVKLEEYALVNLSKSVYNVRHIIEGNEKGEAASGAEDVPFEKLDGTNFLYTPNWETAIGLVSGINGVIFNNETGEFGNITSTETWFFNTLNNVYKESNKEWTNATQFAELPKEYTTNDADKVYPGGNNTNQGQHKENLANIGNLLAYCLENSTDVTHQTHGLSTGITFKAQIYDAEMKPIQNMYRYKGYVFDGLANIKAAFPNDKNLEGLNDQTSSPKEFEKAGVTVYNQNTCYYYTTEIKHFDNNIYPGDVDAEGKLKEPTLGNMEFAIMRNNIYSLAVTAIEKIGDPYVDPIPSTLDEIAKPKLKVEAKIMPWIVRYHNIDFK